jgi:hypothetical protein
LRLLPLNIKDLTLGRLVVILAPDGNSVSTGLRVVSSLTPSDVTIATIVPQGQQSSSETLPASTALRRLRVPLFEKGDTVFIHKKKATVAHHAINELFIGVSFHDEPSKQILTNLVHVNADALLEKFDLESTQLYQR